MSVETDSIIAQKMAFIYNALEDGWEVKKKGGNYIFKKRHHNRREVFLDSYLEQFIARNLNVVTIPKANPKEVIRNANDDDDDSGNTDNDNDNARRLTWSSTDE